jgi:hypothetical protein
VNDLLLALKATSSSARVIVCSSCICSFYPLLPGALGSNVDYGHADKFQMPCTPDILITPSKNKQFAQVGCSLASSALPHASPVCRLAERWQRRDFHQPGQAGHRVHLRAGHRPPAYGLCHSSSQCVSSDLPPVSVVWLQEDEMMPGEKRDDLPVTDHRMHTRTRVDIIRI